MHIVRISGPSVRLYIRTYHNVLVEELKDCRRWGLQDCIGVSIDPDLVEQQGLVPGGTDALLHHTGTHAVPHEGHLAVRVRQPRLVAGVHVTSLVDVAAKLVGMAVWGKGGVRCEM